VVIDLHPNTLTAIGDLPKLGHACVVEDPEACATEIRRFVKSLS
jgi:hypothetical protein